MSTADPKLTRLEVRPDEGRVQGFNLAGSIPRGATISAPELTSLPLGLVPDATNLTLDQKVADGAIAQARITGGTDGEDYLITVTATVSTGGKVTEYFVLQCRDGLVA